MQILIEVVGGLVLVALVLRGVVATGQDLGWGKKNPSVSAPDIAEKKDRTNG